MAENTATVRMDQAMYVIFKPHGKALSLGFVERRTLFSETPDGATLCNQISIMCQPRGNLSRPAGSDIHILENIGTVVDSASKYPCT